jgi:hypothetical protein
VKEEVERRDEPKQEKENVGVQQLKKRTLNKR